jgi:membrane protein implicated in regulation of membrane protease activity
MPLSNTNADRLERVLSVLDPAKGGSAEVRADGSLWMRSSPTPKWHRSVTIRGHELHAARAWVVHYMARRASQGA